MKGKSPALLAVVAFMVMGQQSLQVKIKSITVGPEPPLHEVACKATTFGYLHVGERTKLTAAEIGDYVMSATTVGKIVILYPESKSGIFAYETCDRDIATTISR